MLSAAFDSQSPASVAATLLLLPVLYFIYAHLVREPTIYDLLPWPGLKDGYFGRIKTRFDFSSRREALHQAFKDYSMNDKPFVWQQPMGRAMVVLPPSSLRWLIDQPHDNVSSHDFFNDNLALETSLMDPQVQLQPIHIKVVQQNLNRALGWTPNYILDELIRCFNDYWGSSTEWHEEIVWNSFIKFVARTVNRMFIGEEICRDEGFLEAVIDYAKIFILQGMKLRPLPSWLRTLISYPMTMPQRRVIARLEIYMGPIIDRRKADFERKLADKSYQYEEPNDLLQWIIQHCYKSDDLSNRNTRRIIKRFMAINFAAIHTTTSNATNLILDLASTDPADEIIPLIRKQVALVYKECKGNWTKAHLVKLSLLDSALRETLRINASGGVWTPSRKVVKKGGITIPNMNLHVPEGAHVAIPSYGLQHLEADSFDYKPFRWSGLRDAKGKGLDEMLEERNLQATATGEQYLPFGHGRDACPGRFFAVQEIKLMMVHFFLNYEVKPLPSRIGAQWFADTPRAPVDAKISIRKIEPPSLD